MDPLPKLVEPEHPADHHQAHAPHRRPGRQVGLCVNVPRPLAYSWRNASIGSLCAGRNGHTCQALERQQHNGLDQELQLHLAFSAPTARDEKSVRVGERTC